MSIPPEVVQDLLPLYLAGETSAATNAWIERQLEQNPALAEQARAMRIPHEDAPPLPATLEMAALRRTHRNLTAMRWLFAIAVACTAIMFSVRGSFGPPFRARFLVLDYPEPLLSIGAVGLLCWIAYFRLKHTA